FYASIHHATNVGSMFRPDNPLLPNYKYVPIGYHGRASSIVVSGTPIRRPSGQTRDDANAPPAFGPTKRLDYELELGAYVGVGNLRTGDLIASGTVAGSTKESRGSLLERAWRGTEPLELPTGERRAFVEDGDEVILRGYAERRGFRRIGLGECVGIVKA